MREFATEVELQEYISRRDSLPYRNATGKCVPPWAIGHMEIVDKIGEDGIEIETQALIPDHILVFSASHPKKDHITIDNDLVEQKKAEKRARAEKAKKQSEAKKIQPPVSVPEQSILAPVHSNGHVTPQDIIDVLTAGPSASRVFDNAYVAQLRNAVPSQPSIVFHQQPRTRVRELQVA